MKSELTKVQILMQNLIPSSYQEHYMFPQVKLLHDSQRLFPNARHPVFCRLPCVSSNEVVGGKVVKVTSGL